MKTKIKKTLYLFSAILLVLTSCSKDETTTEQVSSAPVFVKKIIRIHNTNNPGGTTETEYYKYDGNKIVSVTESVLGFVSTYTYTGNVITKIEERVNGDFRNSNEYTYYNGKVVVRVFKSRYGSTTLTTTYSYTYNPNGTVSYNSTGNYQSTGVLTFLNGNLVKNETFYNGSPNTIYTFEFDTKNNPFKNVLGFNLLFDQNTDMFSPNNMIKDGSRGSNNFDNYIFKYDANGFPTEKKLDVSTGGSLTQYFY